MQMLDKKYFRKSKSPISGNMEQTRILNLRLDIAQIFPRYQNIYQQKFETIFCSSPELKHFIFGGTNRIGNLGGLVGVSDRRYHHYRICHKILHKSGGLTFRLVQSLKIPFLGSLRSIRAN